MANTKPLASQVKYGNDTNVDVALKKAQLTYNTYAEALSVANKLPNDQVVIAQDTQTRYKVSAGSLVFDAFLPEKKLGSFVVPEMFGDTTTPTNTATTFNAAANYCRTNSVKLMAGASLYTLGADVNFRSVNVDFSGAKIAVASGFALTIGGNAGTTLNPKQVFGDVYRQGTNWSLDPSNYTEPSLKVIGSKGQEIHVAHTDRVLFFMSTNPATFPADASQAYSTFHFRLAIIIDIDTDPAYGTVPPDIGVPDGPGSPNQWFNENTFHLGRCIQFLMRGSYYHNNNRIHGGCMETANAHINIQTGNKNRFHDMRFEGAANITFGQYTEGNIIQALWYSSASYAYADPVNNSSGIVTDLGKLNIIKNIRNALSDSSTVHLVSTQDLQYNNQYGNFGFRMSTRRAIRAVPRTTIRVISESDIFECSQGDYLFSRAFSLPSTTSSYITRFFLYDENFTIITPTAAMVETGNFNQFFSDRIEGRTTSLDHARLGILSSSVKYVKVQFLNSGSTSEDNATKLVVIRVSRRTGRNGSEIFKDSSSGLLKLAATKPTQFIGQLGATVPGAISDYRCIFFLDTTLTVAAASSSTVVTTSSTTAPGTGAVAINDLIGIDLDDGTTHWTTISGIGGGNITIVAGLPSSASVGSHVYISRLSPR